MAKFDIGQFLVTKSNPDVYNLHPIQSNTIPSINI